MENMIAPNAEQPEVLISDMEGGKIVLITVPDPNSEGPVHVAPMFLTEEEFNDNTALGLRLTKGLQMIYSALHG